MMSSEIENVATIQNLTYASGYNQAVERVKQIIRHENSVIGDSEIQKILDRILRAVEELGFKQSHKEEDNGTENKTTSEG